MGLFVANPAAPAAPALGKLAAASAPDFDRRAAPAAATPAAAPTPGEPVGTAALPVPAGHEARLRFYWYRMAAALFLVALMLVVGLWSRTEGFDDWSSALIHAFELTLGLVVGLIGGEVSASRAQA